MKILPVRGKVALAAAMALLAGCYHQVAINISQAELMPDSIARRVVERHLGPGWLDRPYLDLLACFRTGVRYVAVSEIRSVFYKPDESAAYLANWVEANLDCELASLRVRNVSEQETRELAAALVSLGASIRPSR